MPEVRTQRLRSLIDRSHANGGTAMPTYVTLLRYTAQGRQAMKDMPSRVQQSKELARSMGGEVKAFYLTMGQYDAVAVTDAPDNATAARAALIIGSAGNVS